jgi:N utilization substance protein B
MPVLRGDKDEPGFAVDSQFAGRMTTYRLAPEGVGYLIEECGLREGDTFEAEHLLYLIERGWATAVPAPAEPEAEAPPATEPEPGPEEAEAPRVEPPPAPAAKDRPRTTPPASPASRPHPTRRTRGREVALQVLYLLEQNPAADTAEIQRFIERRLREPRLREFTQALVDGVREHRPRIDALISEVAENWRLDRMAAIDRNILRLGAFEMLFCPEVPTKVAINEALELAKRYSTAQSSRFVNGILDRLQAAEPSADPVEGDAPAPEAVGDEPPAEADGPDPA